MAVSAPSKEALAIIVDVSHSMTQTQLESVRQTCSDLILQKILYSPSDEVGLIFAGTNGAKNRLHNMSSGHYNNITVMRPVMKPTGAFIADIESAVAETGQLDMFEAVLCAADLINEATSGKKYNRRIMLISQVSDLVKNKKALPEVQSALSAHSISLVVVGVDFTVSDDQDWATLTTTKQQNERVLSIICQQLGDSSFLFPISDAMEALASLRKKNVSERTSSRGILSIGDIRIAVYIYSKTLQARVPTLKKCSTAKDSNVTIDRRYFIASSMKEIDATERVKVLKYGRSVVPCSAIDEEQLKFVSDRSLDCLGFVNISDIPPHILTGGCKAVGPALGDTEGAVALTAFIQGMVHLGRAMLVRFVRCANASPVVCACFPSSKAERHILYMVPLPYSEDFRRYLLPDFSDVSLTSAESNVIDDMVTSMTLKGDEGLRLNRIYNPALQQYYTWVKSRYVDSLKLASSDHGASAASFTPLPGMPNAVLHGATCWGAKGNILHEFLASSRSAREQVAKCFPFVPPILNASKPENKPFWFGTNGSAPQRSDATHCEGPPTSRGLRVETTAVTPTLTSGPARSSADNYLSSARGEFSATASSPSPSTEGSAAAAFCGAPLIAERATMAISTANPVESFLAMVNNKQVDQVDQAIFRMGELVLTLLKLSIGNQFFPKCEQCVRALRSACIAEDEPGAYYGFLQRLQLMTKGGTHDVFWTHHVVANGLGPITLHESPASEMTTEQALRFTTEGIKGPAPPQFDDEAEGAENILDILE